MIKPVVHVHVFLPGEFEHLLVMLVRKPKRTSNTGPEAGVIVLRAHGYVQDIFARGIFRDVECSPEGFDEWPGLLSR